MMWRLGTLVAILASSVVTTRVARADDTAESRKAAGAHFAEGTRAFNAGDYTRAADEFDKAYLLSPHFDVLWNAAQAADRGGALARAANGYLHYLKLAPAGAADRDHATRSLHRLAQQLSLLHLRFDRVVDVRLDTSPIDVDVDEVYVEPGIHVLAGKAADTRVSERVATHEGETLTITLTPPETPGAAPPALASPSPPPPRREAPRGWPQWVFVAGAGATAVAGGFAIASGLDTVSAAHRFDAHPNAAALDAGRGKQLRTNVLYAATGVLAIATAVTGIWLVDWHPAGARSITLGLGVADAEVAFGF